MILLLLSVFSLAQSIWETLPEDDCYNCVRFVEDGANFTSQAIVQSSLIVGARDKIFKFDFGKRSAEQYPDREISRHDYDNCRNGGRTELMCGNYYKVIIPIDHVTVLLCGTSAFNPQCDFRLVSDLRYTQRQNVVWGEGLCPADPKISVSYSKISPGVGFSGTCREVCNEFAISRMNLQPGSLVATARTFKTEETLSGADFVYSFPEGDYVYFLFKETALEEEREYVYSRIGRLCKNDVGSSSPFFKDYFKTFLKVRIYCTSNEPGQTPFDHNELGGALFQDGMLYATFSGPKNLYTGSIVCKYPLSVIQSAFKGRYRVHDMDANKWVEHENVHPVQCSTHPTVYNASKIVLMYDPITSSRPLYSTEHRLTGLAGRSVTILDSGATFFELFSSNGYGSVVRISYIPDTHKVYDRTYKVANSGTHSLLLDGEVLYAVSDNTVAMIPSAYDCSKATTCQSCIGHHYPLCGWCYGNGDWTCSERNTCTTNWISPVSACQDSPVFSKTPRNSTLKDGESVVLQCGSRDNQYFSWSKAGGTLPRKSRRMEGGYLLIPLVVAEDSGCYRCNMNNTSGPVFAEGCITVVVAPSFTSDGKPHDISIQHGYSNLHLPCAGTGSPAPTTTWERLGTNLPEGSVVLESGTLKLIRVMTMDAGQYKCRLENIEGTVETIITLHVDTPTVIIPNGTEEQLNANQLNRRTIITLVICVIVIIICFVTGFVAYNCRKKRKRRGTPRHQYLENDNPMAAFESPVPLQALQHPTWSDMTSEEPTSPLSNVPPCLSTLEEVDDEAPPAYTEHPHILRHDSSDYHLLSCPYGVPPSTTVPPTQPSPNTFLYQPIQNYSNTCIHVPSPVPCRHVTASPACRQCSPRAITAVRDNSPEFLSTLPVRTVGSEPYDELPLNVSSSNIYNDLDPPD